jgi:hypothetical protein
MLQLTQKMGIQRFCKIHSEICDSTVIRAIYSSCNINGVLAYSSS